MNDNEKILEKLHELHLELTRHTAEEEGHLGAIHADLREHIARDEAVWKQVEENEQEIKELVEQNGRVRTKLAVITATIAGAGASIPSLIKLLL